MNLTLFEIKIIKAILDNNVHIITSDIKRQFNALSVKSRQYTGVGLWVKFKLNTECLDIDSNINMTLGGIHAEIVELKHGAQFILYIKNGMISALECVSYDEKWPKRELILKQIYKVRKDGSLQL